MRDRSSGEFDVFLNYPGGSASDSEHVRRLAELLARHGFGAWFTERDARPGATPEAIERQLATVPVFVACLGERPVGRFGRWERQLAAERAERDGDVLLCTVVLPGGSPFAVRAELPAAFARGPVFDFRAGLTSIAALVPELWARTDPERLRLFERVVGAVRSGAFAVVLVGPPGAGKSALAEVVSARVADDFPGGQAVLMADPARGVDGMAGLILRFLRIEVADVPRSERLGLYRHELARRRCLVVLDEADRMDVAQLVPPPPSVGLVVARERPELDGRTIVFEVPLGGAAADGGRRGRLLNPGFASDLPVGVDQLGVETEVASLCSVIAARDVVPPLSIGLFGDWGAGKSFFIQRMRARIELLANASRATSDTAFHGSIRQIVFNAWHYADANLWASLARGVFEGLADDPDEQQRIVEQLAVSGEQLQDAKAERAVAQERVRQAEQARRQAQDELARAKLRLRDAAGAVGDAIERDPGLAARWADVRAAARLPGLLLTLVAAVGVVGVVLAFTTSFEQALPVLVAAALGPLGWALGAAGWAARLQRATAQRVGGEQIAQLEAEVETWSAQDQLAARRVDDAQRLHDELQLAIREIRSGRRLFSFIEERVRGDAYRPYHGVVELVRRDFERLAALMAAREDGARDGLPEIDRIVLYVDDLDRCPARRVIEVLEAVHLLLASNLFVVVVAVDPRWLLRALRSHYQAEMVSGDGEWAPAPRDYLEKIFQIPYSLPRMEEDGFRRLVGGLLPVEGPAADGGRAIESGDRAGREVSNAAPVVEDHAADAQGPRPSLAHASGSVDLRPDGLRVQPAELEFMQRLAGLIETPRAAKRLTNVYRLLRVSLDERQLDALLGRDGSPPAYRCVLLLLAVVVGVPSLSAPLCDALDRANAGTWWAVLDGLRPGPGDEAALARLQRGTAGLREEPLPDRATFAAWAPHVTRYAFR